MSDDRFDEARFEELHEKDYRTPEEQAEYERLRSTVREAITGIVEAFNEYVPSEVWQQYAERVDYSLEERIYEHATLVGPDGTAYSLSHAYVWCRRFDGDYNVDILIREVPDDIDLSECRLRIANADGVPLHEGELRDEGNRQDGLGTICVQVAGNR